MTRILLKFATPTIQGVLDEDGQVHYMPRGSKMKSIPLHAFIELKLPAWRALVWRTPDDHPCWVTLGWMGKLYGGTLEVIEPCEEGRFKNWYVSAPSNGKFRVGRTDSKPYDPEDWKMLRERVVSAAARWANDLGKPRVIQSFPDFMQDAPCTRFELWRDDDVSGVSGTGLIAEGVKFGDGKCVMRWRTRAASVSVYDSMKDLEHNHLHGGKSRIVWVD
jgi:hypothetical protein